MRKAGQVAEKASLTETNTPETAISTVAGTFPPRRRKRTNDHKEALRRQFNKLAGEVGWKPLVERWNYTEAKLETMIRDLTDCLAARLCDVQDRQEQSDENSGSVGPGGGAAKLAGQQPGKDHSVSDSPGKARSRGQSGSKADSKRARGVAGPDQAGSAAKPEPIAPLPRKSRTAKPRRQQKKVARARRR